MPQAKESGLWLTRNLDESTRAHDIGKCKTIDNTEVQALLASLGRGGRYLGLRVRSFIKETAGAGANRKSEKCACLIERGHCPARDNGDAETLQ